MHGLYDKARLRSALTLLEMVIAMGIMGIVFTGVVLQFRGIQNSWDSKQGGAEALQNGRVLLDHLYRNLSKAHRINAVSGPADDNGYIEFEGNDGTNSRYEISEGDYVTFGPTGGLSPLAGPVTSLRFTCYDACDLDTAIIDVDQIRNVKFEATFVNSSQLGHDPTFVGQAYLRTNSISLDGAIIPGVAVSNKAEIEGFGWISMINGSAAVSTNSTSHNKIILEDIGIISGDVYVGPGGEPDDVIRMEDYGHITGSTGILTEAVEIPVPVEPSLGGSVGDRTYDGFSTTTISEDLHCDKFEIKNFATVKISGDVIILVEDEFEIEDFGQLRILADGSLTLFTKNEFKIKDFGKMNINTMDSSQVTVNHLSSENIHLEEAARLCAGVVAPYCQLYIKDTGRFYGTLRGKQIKVKDIGRVFTLASTAGGVILP
jgi:type II secretory pathway pseudopilin PulG